MGVHRGWFPDGQLRDELHFVDGEMEGAWTRWNQDGSVREQGEYQGDAANGWWRTYHQGVLVEERLYGGGELLDQRWP